MARSFWKGPFVDGYLLKKADAARAAGRHSAVKTWSRRSTILPQFVGLTFQVHNGNKFIPVLVSEDMVGHKLGEFAPTRTFRGHSAADKKATKAPDTMSKPVRKRSLADNEAKAVTRSIRISPRKLNELATIIRGMKVDKALAELTFSRRRIAKDVKKTLESAIANAENNHDLDINNLVVAEACVGKNLVMKRWTPARAWPGRQHREILQRTDDHRSRSEGGRLMGQKVNPIGLRLGINRTWDSRWFANSREYGKLLHEDMKHPQLSQDRA